MNIIKKIRHELIMTQTDLAEILEVNKSCVCLWESERRFPSMKNIKKLVEISSDNGLKFTISDFLIHKNCV